MLTLNIKKPKAQILLKILKIFNKYKYILLLFGLNIIIIKIEKEKEKNQELYEKIVQSLDNEFYKSINDSDISHFWEINHYNILVNEKNFERYENPEISVIILLYNQANCIHKCLRSVQNQSLKNIEIIIIDDCSLDNSTETIKSYQIEDPRILLVKHQSNYGKIKSRSDGIRIAKGKYITFIDGDDSLIHKDILLHSLKLAKSADLDVVEFKISYYINRRFINNINNYYQIKNINKKIIYQPELKTKFISLIDREDVRGMYNRNICGKLIKNRLFKKVLNNIGKKFTEDYINYFEDTLMVVSLFQTAKSFYLMKERGYYYAHDECKNKFKFVENKKCKANNKIRGMDPIKFLIFLIDKTGDTYLERKLLYSEILSIDYYVNMTNLIKAHFEMIYKVIDTTLKSRFLTYVQNNKIKGIKTKLLKKEKSLKK